MNKTVTMLILGLGLATSVGTASAAGGSIKVEDITMQVMEGEQPQEIIQKIEMPPNATQSDANERQRRQERERRRELQYDAIDAMQEQQQQMQEMQEQMKDTINDTRNFGMGLSK